jgi:hypothetical protein
MRRRALLRATALAGVAGFAGCTTDGPSDDSGGGGDGGDGGDGQSPTDSPTGSPTGTPTDSPTDSPADDPSPTRTPLGNGLVSESFAMTARDCGQGRSTVDIDFDGTEVTLDGVIDGSNGCYRAEQGSVDYDPQEDRLHVNVRAYEPEDAMTCTQCIVDIEYEARYVFEGEAPKEVTVAHDGRDIATAAHGSSSVSSTPN